MVDAPAAQRLLVAQPATLSVTYASDPGAVTLTLTRADGTALVTGAATSGAGTTRTYALTAAQTADLDRLTAVWTSPTLGTVTQLVEVLGAHLFTVEQARAFDKKQLASTTAYPDSAIVEARDRITDAFEQLCGLAFVPRYRRVVLDGPAVGHVFLGALSTAPGALLLPDLLVTRVRSVETRSGGDWTAFTAQDLADVVIEPGGVLRRELRGGWPLGRAVIRVGYEHGYAAPPLDVQRAALILATNQLVPSNLPERALSQATEVGTFRLATAGYGRNNWFGIPSVDAVLEQHLRRTPRAG